MNSWKLRLAGLVMLVAALWFGGWVLTSMNSHALWLAIPFAGANLLIMMSVLTAIVNNWRREVPVEHLVAPGDEPPIAILIPTCGEPAAMVARTIRSILRQEWPQRRMKLIISDDGHASEIAAMTKRLGADYPLATLVYHEPPPRGAPERKGEAKAGNLNAALALAVRLWPEIAYIETRDADDEVGDPRFLRQCIGQLLVDERVAFVQTIKHAHVSEGDPFNNLETIFYQQCLFARNAANAVFPCGSGLVWRRAALDAIDGFPTWNLVEDLQSGVEALRRGWRGVYLPVVGAVGQHAPEDMPNVYQQRGTWALDTMRLLLWGSLRGLSLRQRLHFIEMGLFYIQSLAHIVILLSITLSLLTGLSPIVASDTSFVLHCWPYIMSVEVFLIVLNGTASYEKLWRARELYIGLAPIFLRACFLALIFGPRRKPVYRVTRKFTIVGWYWNQILPQVALIAMTLGAIGYRLAVDRAPNAITVGTAFCAVLYLLMLYGFVRKSWFGMRWRAPWRKLATAPALAEIGDHS